MWYDQILRRNKFQLYSTKMSRYLHSKVYIYTKKQTAYFHFYDTHPKRTIFWLLSEYSRGQFRLFTGPIVIFHCESIHWYWKWFCRDLLKFLQSRIVPVFNNQGSTYKRGRKVNRACIYSTRKLQVKYDNHIHIAKYPSVLIIGRHNAYHVTRSNCTKHTGKRCTFCSVWTTWKNLRPKNLKKWFMTYYDFIAKFPLCT